MDKVLDLIKIFREQTKYIKYIDFLHNINEFLEDNKKTCAFCTENCGNSWCSKEEE